MSGEAPKRPLNAYIKFSMEQTDLKGMGIKEKAPIIKERWDKLADNKKDKLNQETKEEWEVYRKAKETLKAKDAKIPAKKDGKVSEKSVSKPEKEKGVKSKVDQAKKESPAKKTEASKSKGKPAKSKK